MKSNFRIVEYNLPAYWASYLINCDSSGISETEREAADKFCADRGISGCAVDCGESFYHWRNDADTGEETTGGDVCQFTFLVPVTAESGVAK